MAAFNKFDCFVGDLGLGVHSNLNTDTLRVYLSNIAPVAGDTVYKASGAGAGGQEDLATAYGYTAKGEDVTNTYSQTSGTATLAIGSDIVWTASGGSIGPFRYAVLYNDTSATDALIGWWDYGSSITVLTGETFTFDMTASLFTIA